ncbi:hypothetical protein H2200_005764 [Cladophialophora chaetospira]|uniref:AB hydrolase-1 domain-containing protein n=1 Tax=Cladophialophora chaetospira TaxID=386627 RepID=A0AA38X9P1_9EURO|nr:hypothetical protein H2200_005764 [Cladophialophora chaetospira]
MELITLILLVILNWGLASAKTCTNMTIPVKISARNGIFGDSIPQIGIEVTDFALDSTRQGHNYSQEILQGYKSVAGTYSLSLTHCNPDSGESKVLQILTHGIGFDKSYWDLPFKNYNYSYVSVAVDQYGYSTLAWDRLGIGASSHGDPLAEIQAPLEQAALAALTAQVRGRGRGRTKVVHVGHSFGSILSYALARDDPSASDGLVLQAWAMNGTFFPDFTFGANMIPVTDLTPAYPAGYFAAGNAAALHTTFLAPGQYDPDIVPYAYANGEPVSIGELLTVGGAGGGTSNFAGPVMVVTGDRDLIFCGGDCYATGDPALHTIMDTSKNFFPKAKNVNVTAAPGAGHALNLQYGHGVVYQQMNDFLVKNGLGAK